MARLAHGSGDQSNDARIGAHLEVQRGAPARRRALLRLCLRRRRLHPKGNIHNSSHSWAVPKLPPKSSRHGNVRHVHSVWTLSHLVKLDIFQSRGLHACDSLLRLLGRRTPGSASRLAVPPVLP